MLTDLLVALSDCVWAFDVDTQSYLFISPSVHAILEYSPKDFQHNKELPTEIIDSRDREEVSFAFLKDEGEDWTDLAYRIVTKSGKGKWINHKRRQLKDEQTGHIISLNVIKDVSDQKTVNYKMHEALGDFNILFNDNPTPMWIYELPSLRILKVNEAAILHYGYSEREFLNMTIRDVRPRFDIAKFNEYLYQKAIPEFRLDGFNTAGVWRHQNKTGEIVYAEITGHEIRYDNKRCRVIIASDVTRQVLQQEEMKHREQFLTSLIDSQTNFLFRIDANGIFTFVNKQYLRVLGYKKNELIGRHFSAIAFEDDIVGCEQALKNCLKAPGKVISLQCRQKDKEGNTHQTKWELVSIINEQGLASEIQGVGQDVTPGAIADKDPAKTAEDISWTKNNLEALINNTVDLTWSIDREGRYVYMNSSYRKRITDSTGVAPKEGDDAYIHSGTTDQVRGEWRSYYNRALTGERYVTRHDNADPTTQKLRHFEISFNPIYKDSKDEIIGVGCFARDITDILDTEAALIKQNEQLRNIASLSSHELRRPVASMLGLMNIMDLENFTNPDNAQIIQHLFTVTKEIDEVIHQIVNNTFIDNKFSL